MTAFRMSALRTLRLFSIAALLATVLVPLAASAASVNAPLVPGQDYEDITDGKTFLPPSNRIEVAEVFAYWCPHCHDFQPKLEAWLRTQPSSVRLVYVPMSNSDDDPFARGYFAALDAGAIPRVHDALFKAVHDSQTVPTNPSIAELATFYGTQGLSAARMTKAMNAPTMAARVAAARQFAMRHNVEGTPTLIIAGRYRVLGNSLDAILDNAGRLIAQLRAGKR